MLRIHDILVWIRISGFVSLTNGFGSSYFRHWPSRGQQKTNFFLTGFFCLLLFQGTFTFFSKMKSHKETWFILLFLLDDRRVQIRIWASDQWIRIKNIRIRDDPDSDPDPLHWLQEWKKKNSNNSNKNLLSLLRRTSELQEELLVFQKGRPALQNIKFICTKKKHTPGLFLLACTLISDDGIQQNFNKLVQCYCAYQVLTFYDWSHFVSH